MENVSRQRCGGAILAVRTSYAVELLKVFKDKWVGHTFTPRNVAAKDWSCPLSPPSIKLYTEKKSLTGMEGEGVGGGELLILS